MRAVGWLGGTSPEVASSISFVTVFAGLIGLYLALRRSFTALVAWTAVLSVWTHPLVLGHAFEARSSARCSPARSGLRLSSANRPIAIDVDQGRGRSRRRVPVHDSLLRRGLHGPHRRRRAVLVAEEPRPSLMSSAPCTRAHRARRVHAVTGGTTARASRSTFLPRPTLGSPGSSSISSCRVHLAAVAVLPGIAIIGAEGRASASRCRPPKPLLGWTASPDWPAFFSIRWCSSFFHSSFRACSSCATRCRRWLESDRPLALCRAVFHDCGWRPSAHLSSSPSGTRTLRHMEEQELYSEQEMGKLLDALRRDTGDAPIAFEMRMPTISPTTLSTSRLEYSIFGGETPFFKSPEIQTPYSPYSSGQDNMVPLLGAEVRAHLRPDSSSALGKAPPPAATVHRGRNESD